jgi:hypothetical protein
MFYPEVLQQATRCLVSLLPAAMMVTCAPTTPQEHSSTVGFEYLPLAIGRIIASSQPFMVSSEAISMQKVHLAMSLLVHSLVSCLKEKLLPYFQTWVQLVLHGVGLFGCALARKYFTKALKILVPLAPLALYQRPINDNRKGGEGHDQVANLINKVLSLEKEGGLKTSDVLLKELSLIDSCSGDGSQLSAGGDCSGGIIKWKENLLSLRYSLRSYQLRGAVEMMACS